MSKASDLRRFIHFVNAIAGDTSHATKEKFNRQFINKPVTHSSY